MCRGLVLTSTRVSQWLFLADESLQELSLEESSSQWTDYSPSQWTDISPLARLTGLTRLELANIYAYPDLAALSELPLQELVILKYHRLELRTFQSGSWGSLRKLHVETAGSARDASRQNWTALADSSVQQELERIGEIVFQLPQLCQLSGFSTLFVVGMKQGLRAWNVAKLAEGTMVTKGRSHYSPLSKMRIWTRPQN